MLLNTRSVTRTAAQLGSSQPSVSRALAQLRALTGDPLLVRTRGGMALTQRAEELSAPLQHWLQATTTLLEPDRFEPVALSRRFRLASTDFGVLAVIAPALERLARAAPEASVEVLPLRGSMLEELSTGSVDLLVSGLEPNPAQTHVRRLFAESFSCVMRRGHPLAGERGAVPLDAFLDWPHIALTVGDDDFDRVERRLGAAGVGRRIVARLPYFGIAPQLIGGSDAIVTLPATAARALAADAAFAMRPAPVAIGTFDYWLIWHERTARDPASMWLRDLLADPSSAERKTDIPLVHLPAA